MSTATKHSEQIDTQDWVPTIQDYDFTPKQRTLIDQLLRDKCVVTFNGSISYQVAKQLGEFGLVETKEFTDGLIYIVLMDDAELLDTIELTDQIAA